MSQCPQCEGLLSIYAAICPHCGFPAAGHEKLVAQHEELIAQLQAEFAEERAAWEEALSKEKTKSATAFWRGVVITFLIGLALLCLYLYITQHGSIH